MSERKMADVSIIMPCYNDGKYITEAVDSVFKQTYSSLELIIIDDGSDDYQTIKVIEELSKSNTKIHLIHTNHIGPAGARNAGIEMASGKYVMPLDADDMIEPTYIEKAISVIEPDESIGVVYCHADLFGEQTGLWQLPDYSLDNMLLDNVVFVTALFRKDDWKRVGGFRTSMKYGMEDYDFWLSILESGKEIKQLPEVLFHYRIKPVSRTTRFQSDVSVVQKTYKDIYFHHSKFYEKYKDEHAIVLRNALIEYIFQVRAYEKGTSVNNTKWTKVAKRLLKKVLSR